MVSHTIKSENFVYAKTLLLSRSLIEHVKAKSAWVRVPLFRLVWVLETGNKL